MQLVEKKESGGSKMPVIQRRKNIDFDWRFSLSDVVSAKDEIYDDSGWRMVNLPHDWSIEGSYEKHHLTGKKCAFLPTGIGWYRKTIHVPEEWLSKYIYILIGQWTAGSYRYIFKADGRLFRIIGELEEKLGYWWYDFPVDNFEAQDYAGTGEVWFTSGEKRKMTLGTQEGKELIIELRGAIGTAYGSSNELKLLR